MRIRRISLWSAVAVLSLLASLACEKRAHAQVSTGNDLNLGGNFNSGFFYTFNGSSPGGGGPIDTSYLNGAQLPFVYCIDIADNVYVPDNYNDTTATTNGTAVYGSSGATLVNVPHANVIAGLLNTYGTSVDVGNTASQITLQQDALQAAIWTAVYGYDAATSTFLVTDSATYNQMLTYLGLAPGTMASGVNLNSAPTASVSSATWLSPAIRGSSTIYQALVTSTTPEPSTFVVAGLGALGFIGYGLRRRSKV